MRDLDFRQTFNELSTTKDGEARYRVTRRWPCSWRWRCTPLLARVKGGILKSRCDICAKPTKGCVFKCNACTFQMHPCCAMLSTQINISVHPHTLRLLPGLSPSSDPTGIACGECNRRRSGRVYHCTVCDYHLHAVCAKNMVNGLEANGIKGLDKPSRVATAARVASQVVIEFIGGLIEGIGEGVGQVIIQSATRGRCCTNRSNTA
ncbi:Cysteine/Histidine-rich C1 domain family protein, putative isoform 2 [Hibiscus syriacus]|uniref:Cysteine/Histidine-rich C1 domain family protein, putative isoform 2 n=1 Tax=Hibiscus syriacus TaxID=106335 RepID=A0A6A2WSE3_HIBSY|nr:Cysteine/Histidine-rich C1 domain family protein, putative isoform 2 [Hibiscus syriacus]